MTAVEWLIAELQRLPLEHRLEKAHLFYHAKAMEKQQIIDAAERWKGTKFAEQYYNETYGGNHIVDTNEMIDHIGDANEMVEISDEEIEQYAKQNAFNYYEFISGAKWYREQLNKKEL